MTIKYRGFTMADKPEVLSLWNHVLVYDRITSERFDNQLLFDENFEPSLLQLAFEDDTLVGFIYGVKRKVPYLTRGLEPDRGWIVQIAVQETMRRQGIGTHLVNLLSQQFKQESVKEITLSAYSPNYFTPGVDVRYKEALAFFDKLGYVNKGDAVSMGVDLAKHVVDTESLIAQQAANGYFVKPYEEKYMLDLLTFAQREFGGGWTRNIYLALAAHQAENRIFIAVDKDDRVIGFVMRAIDGNETRFGPIGVDSTIRSKGLGSVLLEVLLDDLIKRGYYYAFFLWTHGDAIRFYHRHGFEVYRTYTLLRKEI